MNATLTTTDLIVLHKRGASSDRIVELAHAAASAWNAKAHELQAAGDAYAGDAAFNEAADIYDYAERVRELPFM